MSIKKQYLKSKGLCKVTFAVDKKMANGAKNVREQSLGDGERSVLMQTNPERKNPTESTLPQLQL